MVNIRDHCVSAAVPFFFKQWGGGRKALHGRKLDRRTYDEFPPEAARTPPPKAERERASREFAPLL